MASLILIERSRKDGYEEAMVDFKALITPEMGSKGESALLYICP